jgi:hypothetical protein
VRPSQANQIPAVGSARCTPLRVALSATTSTGFTGIECTVDFFAGLAELGCGGLAHCVLLVLGVNTSLPHTALSR